MNIRIAAPLAAVAAGLLKRVGAFVVRFVHDQPADEHEAKIFVHLNGLVEAVANRLLNRTFTPVPLRAVK